MSEDTASSSRDGILACAEALLHAAQTCAESTERTASPVESLAYAQAAEKLVLAYVAVTNPRY